MLHICPNFKYLDFKVTTNYLQSMPWWKKTIRNGRGSGRISEAARELLRGNSTPTKPNNKKHSERTTKEAQTEAPKNSNP